MGALGGRVEPTGQGCIHPNPSVPTGPRQHYTASCLMDAGWLPTLLSQAKVRGLLVSVPICHQIC